MWNRTHLVLALVTAGALAAGPARADAAAQARFHDELARKHYDRGRYEEAVREFFLEQRLAPNPRIAFNIALCFQQLGRREEAYGFFDEYLAASDPDVERRTYAEAAVKKLAAKVALVRVTSNPSGARIYVDEREHGEYGITPRTIALGAGAHRIWVELEGHRPAETRVAAKTGEVVESELGLARVVGSLRVESSVPGRAEVRTSEGALVAEGNVPLRADLPPGPYEIAVRAPGHLLWKSVASVQEGEVSRHSAVPQRAPSPTGDVTVTANIAGALVELDGQPAGFTPTVLSSVTTGEHVLGVRGQGVVPWRGRVPVRAAERSWVTVTLEEPPVTVRSPATWVVGGIGVAALIGAGVAGVLAADTHSEFESMPANSDRSATIERGRSLDTAADVLLVTGVLVTGTAVGLYFWTAETRGRPSSASIARGER